MLNTNERNTKALEETNERMAKESDMMNERLKSHGERLGMVEKSSNTSTLLIEKLAKRVEDNEVDIKEIKLKGSKRWDGMVEKIVCVIIGAVFMFIFYQVGLS